MVAYVLRRHVIVDLVLLESIVKLVIVLQVTIWFVEAMESASYLMGLLHMP